MQVYFLFQYKSSGIRYKWHGKGKGINCRETIIWKCSKIMNLLTKLFRVSKYLSTVGYIFWYIVRIYKIQFGTYRNVAVK